MEDTKPKAFVFILMPFNDDFKDVYEAGIKPACKDAGAYCERVDEQNFFDEDILERTYNQIAKADVVIADMTGRNANVFYETGYAHALNKRVVLLTQNASDIPFNLKHYPHIVYAEPGKIASLKSQLEKKIRWCIDNPKVSLQDAEINVDLFINSIPLSKKPEISYDASGFVEVNVDIFNPTSKVLNSSSFNFALISPYEISVRSPIPRSHIQLKDGRHMYNLLTTYELFPGGWDSFKLWFLFPETKWVSREVTLRMFTQLGPRDFQMILKPDW